MPRPTPFHKRTSELCTSMLWKEWAGYYAVRSFDTCHEPEYYAFRHSAGLIDVTPLYKYEVYGPDAARFLSRIVVRNIEKLKVGRVTYCCWCDGNGKIIDDGTVSRLDDDYFRLTAALPTYYWLKRFQSGYDVTVEDSSERLAVLSLQGPYSRDILDSAVDADLRQLKFFGVLRTKLGSIDAWVSRTGYTGDLGYEIWVERDQALKLWDSLIEAGRPYQLMPCGLDAMDVTRVEAGFILNGVDYYSAPTCIIEARKSTPYEVGLGWTVNLKRGPFNGHKALREEKQNGSRWALVGLVLDWDEYEALFEAHGLPPHVNSAAWRTAVPVYDPDGEVQIGQATSGAWSPLLKKNLALASVYSEYSAAGTELQMEVTVEFSRRTVTAVVTETPFFNPERKRA
ncbi:MAG: aminomethyl transferase family protein [Candidatus Dadabacteria bacterium]|nr:MAG: aminomethyl transferase family protein [Candidatus Dadabacteria bacterium]